MFSKKIMFGAAIAVVTALMFGSSATSVTTVSVTDAGTSTPAKTTMQAGDLIDVKSTLPSTFTGDTNQVIRETTDGTIGASWTGSSLQLKDALSITKPEGWDLQYTTDGTTYSATAPTDLTSVVGVRSSGNFTKTSSSAFQSTTTAVLMATATDFNGGTGGDGFNLTFAGDRVYNVFHHAASIYLDCHLKSTGGACYGSPKIFTGYETPNSSHGFLNADETKMFIPVMKTVGTKLGLACIDLSVRVNPVLCSTPFVELATTNNRQNLAGATQVGQKLYIANPYDWKLYCFDLATAAECATTSSASFTYTQGGYVLEVGNAITTSPWTVYGRVNNIGGKIFWSSKTKLGCYDPATGTNCGTSTPVAIGASVVSTTGNYSNVIATENLPFQFPMFAVRSTTGTLLGACYFASAQCFTPVGEVDNSILPTNLKAWMKEHPLPKWVTSDSGQHGEYDNKIYFPVGPSTSATNDVYCFDFTTEAACSQFGTAGTKTGVNVRLYSIQADPDPLQPNCLWTNSDSGKITTLNATTGAAGCANASSTVRLPYTSILPRMSCNEAGRIRAWGVLDFHSPGISASVLRVTVLDSSGNAITGYNDVPLTDLNNEDGKLDLSGLLVSTSGTKPTILVTATISVAGSILANLTAKVGFEADDPQLCIVLRAKVKCSTPYTPAAGDVSVGNGVITIATRTRGTPYDLSNVAQAAYAEVTESLPQNLTGTGTVVCPASVSNDTTVEAAPIVPVPVVTPPKTKRPPVTITIGGFKDGSPVLTKEIQAKITAFIKKYNDYPIIETVGFTEGPQVLKTDYALSKARAVNATNFIKKNLKKTFKKVKVKSGQDKIEASKVRRITITLTDE